MILPRLAFGVVVLAAVGLSLAPEIAPSQAQAQAETATNSPLLLPAVLLEPSATPTLTPTASPTATVSPTPTGCQPNDLERVIAERMLAHPEQAHPVLRCDPLLERFARDRARDMGTRGYFSHITPEGLGPNVLLRQAGYPLWSGYSNANTANSVEIMYAGWGSRPPDPDDLELVAELRGPSPVPARHHGLQPGPERVRHRRGDRARQPARALLDRHFCPSMNSCEL